MLNDVGARGFVHVAAGVVVCVPLAAPRAGHARHAPETQAETQSPTQKAKTSHACARTQAKNANTNKTYKNMQTHQSASGIKI